LQSRISRAGAAGKHHTPLDFDAIGSGRSVRIGVAVARGNDKIMLIDGDDSLYQHIQEPETVRRHGLKLLICILNDGGYGADCDPWPRRRCRDRRCFWAPRCQGESMGQFERLFRDHEQSAGSTLRDIHIDDLIPSQPPSLYREA
jgi:hypothetical protein